MNEVKRRIIVVAPSDRRSGGALVLQYLCALLIENGYDAYIYPTTKICPPHENVLKWRFYRIIEILMSYIFNILKPITILHVKKWIIFRVANKLFKIYTPIIFKNPLYKKSLVANDDIVVYPEYIVGNPLNAKRVVRWLLYNPRWLSYNPCYGKKDLFFCYDLSFNDINRNPKNRILNIVYVNNQCKQWNFEKRDGVCYLLRKGKNRKDLPKAFNGIILDDLPDIDKISLFNKCKYCVSYDTKTFYSSMAAICGCISIVVPEENVKKETCFPDEQSRYGIAYGFDEEEIQKSIETRGKLIEKMSNQRELNNKSINNFIKECDLYWK